MKSTVIAIDGPAGAGKSTVARLLAKKCGASYINTGNLYRALALAAFDEGIDIENVPASFLARQHLEFKGEVLFLNGVDRGAELRTARVAEGASVISKQPPVREYLLDVQRKSADGQWIVMEGRDIGTVIFPNAACKFFVTASVEERARRRLAQSGEVEKGATLESVAAEIRRRDERDSNREIAPLRPAEDAEIIDTTGIGIDEVVDLLAQKVAAGKC
jgi:cytidylate kinase